MGRIVRVGCVLLIAMISACGPADNAARESGRSVYAHGDSITISGTLVDSRCLHLDPANVGVDHVRPEGAVTACAQACANMGFPTAVLLDGQPGNDVWVLITVPAILADYMAETVRVSGTVRSAGVLIPSRVEYMQDGTWLNIL